MLGSCIEEFSKLVGRDLSREVVELLKEHDIKESDVSDCFTTSLKNLELNDMPALAVVVGNEYFYVVYDDGLYLLNDFDLEYSTDGYDTFNIGSLRPDVGSFTIPRYCMEELRSYGSSFSLLLEVGKWIVKVSGQFLDAVVEYLIPYDDLPRKIHDTLDKELDEVLPNVMKVLASYSWVPTDAWRGHYEAPNSVDEFIKVVEGWVGIGSSDPHIQKLADVSNMKTPPPVTPILFVFPRSSNICVTYFDVWVPKGKVSKFKRWYGEVDRFSFSRGVYVKTI